MYKVYELHISDDEVRLFGIEEGEWCSSRFTDRAQRLRAVQDALDTIHGRGEVVIDVMPIRGVKRPARFDDYVVFAEVPDALSGVLLRDLKPEFRGRHTAALENRRPTTGKPTTKKRARHK